MKDWDNKDYVLEYVKESGISLMFASNRLKADKDVVLEAVKADGIAYFYGDARLKNSKEFALDCAKYSHLCLGAVNKQFFADYSWVKDCVTANPKTFFVFANYFNYSSSRELCLLACRDYTTLSVMDKSLLTSEDFALKLITANALTFKILAAYSGENGPHNQNLTLIKQAVLGNAFCYTFIADNLKNDTRVLEELIKLNSNVYFYLDNKNKLNPKLALLAVMGNAELLAEVPSIVCTPKFLAMAIEANADVYNHIKDKDKNPSLAGELNLLNVDNIDKYVAECAKSQSFNLKIEKQPQNPNAGGGLALI